MKQPRNSNRSTRRHWCVALGAAIVAGRAHAAVSGPDAAEPIRIGMVNAQTGPAADFGRGMRQAVEAVFAAANRAGGVHGRPIQLLVADDGYEPEQAVDQTVRLVMDEQVLALLGAVGTATSNAVLPLLAEFDIAFVGAMSGSNSLRSPVRRQVFNLRASYAQETEALVELLYRKEFRKIAVVHQNDSFGQSVLQGVSQAMTQRGLPAPAAAPFQRNTTAVRLALQRMATLQPEAIVFAGPYQPAAAFIRQARKQGITAQFAAVSFVGSESLLALLGSEGEGMLISQVVPSPADEGLEAAQTCRRELRQHAPVPLGHVEFEACLSAHLLVKALWQAGPSFSRPGLVRALEGLAVSDLGGLPLGWTPASHQASDRVYLTQLIGGRVVPVR